MPDQKPGQKREPARLAAAGLISGGRLKTLEEAGLAVVWRDELAPGAALLHRLQSFDVQHRPSCPADVPGLPRLACNCGLSPLLEEIREFYDSAGGIP